MKLFYETPMIVVTRIESDDIVTGSTLSVSYSAVGIGEDDMNIDFSKL